MSDFKTPTRSKDPKASSTVCIPPSPLMKKIGYGTGVAVYELIRSPALNNLRSPWAIKKLLKTAKRSKLTKRLGKEAELLCKLQHPNIIGFRAFVNGCLAMEECDYCLGDLIEKRHETESQPFPAKDIIKVASDISKALDYLHNKQLLMHCDIKSYNVLVKGDFEVCKLCDFGVALKVDEKGFCVEDKDYEGTTLWMSPEVTEEPPIITTKADIYAFGLTIWEMLALVPPTDGFNEESFEDDDDSFQEVKIKERPPLPDIEFGDDYTFVLECYFCCTKGDYKERPSASDLIMIFSEINAEKNEN